MGDGKPEFLRALAVVNEALQGTVDKLNYNSEAVACCLPVRRIGIAGNCFRLILNAL